ncbi:hypothetical protein [Cupriavidus basilensis]|uniref:hypothetical protein n=1 Tax=Cupriavidus basilensis TaxID=68895 RepID=UPI0023E884EC|nr:hypothetical protein [Cupriavidus basilensis]MDF3889197.1 hypothetical protein [Cupriavidus basilensis]
MRSFRSAIALLLVVVGACGSINRYETAQQPLGQALFAGVGDVVIRIDRQRDLQNVVGKADMWGRKTNEGFTEIRYLGIDADGSIVFARQDLAIHTDETTVTRMGMVPVPVSSTTQATGRVGNYSYAGTATTTGTAWAPSPHATTLAIPSNNIPIRLTPGQARLIRVGGFTVRIREVTAATVTYSVEQ